MSKAAEYRPYATHTVQNWINVGICLHVDTWLYVDQYDNLALVVRVGDGLGREHWIRAFGMIWHGEFGVWGLHPLPNAADVVSSGTELTLGENRARQLLRGQEQTLFNTLIRPFATAAQGKREFRRVSICHHMVKARYVNDPCEGMANSYATTGRAQRDLKALSKAKLARIVQRNSGT